MKDRQIFPYYNAKLDKTAPTKVFIYKMKLFLLCKRLHRPNILFVSEKVLYYINISYFCTRKKGDGLATIPIN